MFISNVDNLNDVALIESDGYYYIEGSTNRLNRIYCKIPTV